MVSSDFDPTSQCEIRTFGEVEVFMVFDLYPTIFAFKSQCPIKPPVFNPFDFSMNFAVVPITRFVCFW